MTNQQIDHAAIIRFHTENTRRREQVLKEEQDQLRKARAKQMERPRAAWQYSDPATNAAAARTRRRQQMLDNRREDANEGA